MERCDNCGGTGRMGTYYEPDPYVVMAVPVAGGTPDMKADDPDTHVTVVWGQSLSFCNEGCSDAWFEARAGEVMVGREWDEVQG